MKISRLIAVFLSCTIALFSITNLTSCVLPPGDVDIQQGSRYYSKKMFDEARHCFEMALEEECSFSKDTVYIYISNCYSQQENYEEAIEYRKKALEICEDVDNYLQLGFIYRVVQDDDEAEKMFNRALELNPKSAPAMASLGSLYMTHDRTDEAIEMFENSLDINNLATQVHADLAVCYARKGMEAEAMGELQWAKEQKCDNIDQFEKEVNELLDN